MKLQFYKNKEAKPNHKTNNPNTKKKVRIIVDNERFKTKITFELTNLLKKYLSYNKIMQRKKQTIINRKKSRTVNRREPSNLCQNTNYQHQCLRQG